MIKISAGEKSKKDSQPAGRPFYVNVMPNPGLGLLQCSHEQQRRRASYGQGFRRIGKDLESYDKITSTGIFTHRTKMVGAATYFVDVMQGRKSKVIKVIKRSSEIILSNDILFSVFTKARVLCGKGSPRNRKCFLPLQGRGSAHAIATIPIAGSGVYLL